MKKILLLLAKGFETFEASVFIDVLGWNNTFGTKDTQLFTCGTTKKVVSTFDVTVEVDKQISELYKNKCNLSLYIIGAYLNPNQDIKVLHRSMDKLVKKN